MTEDTIPQAPFKFTQARLDALPPATGKRYSVKDTEQPGLICIVHPPGSKHPEGLKVLQIYRKPKGGAAPVRVKVCNLGELPMTALKGCPSVRSAADTALAQLRQGVNPNEAARQQKTEDLAKRKAAEVADITLGVAFKEYVKLKALRPSTLKGYRLAVSRDLVDWEGKPLRQITGAMAVTRYAELAKESAHTATRAMRVLRAVHRFATDFYGNDLNEVPFGRCPVDKVNRVQRRWSRTEARTNKVRTEELPAWLEAVRGLPEAQRRDDGDWARVALYLELVLLTGLRRREAGFLRWADVDFRRELFTVRETKNHRDHTLPMTARVREILTARQGLKSKHVFGTAECHRQLAHIERTTGIHASPHDLRRSWAVFADKAGLGAYAIKAALNHMTTGDVTGIHYAQLDAEDLRPLMQRVEDFILRHAERGVDNVVTRRREAGA